MIQEELSLKEYGFLGHLVMPERPSTHGVVVVMGGEQSQLPGGWIAERFADYGMMALSVSLFGAQGLPGNIDRVPLELVERAIDYLREVRGARRVSVYGMSMGSVFAAMAAVALEGVDDAVLVSPTHAAFQGTREDRRSMTGHSMITWRGEELPFLRQDFSAGGAVLRYVKVPGVDYPVTQMWKAFYDAYQDPEAAALATLPLERATARLMLLAGEEDEAWPAAMSLQILEKRLARYGRTCVARRYPGVGHLLGVMPSREKHPLVYRAAPLVGLAYRSLSRQREEVLAAIEQTERDVIAFLTEGEAAHEV